MPETKEKRPALDALIEATDKGARIPKEFSQIEIDVFDAIVYVFQCNTTSDHNLSVVEYGMRIVKEQGEQLDPVFIREVLPKALKALEESREHPLPFTVEASTRDMTTYEIKNDSENATRDALDSRNAYIDYFVPILQEFINSKISEVVE